MPLSLFSKNSHANNDRGEEEAQVTLHYRNTTRTVRERCVCERLQIGILLMKNLQLGTEFSYNLQQSKVKNIYRSTHIYICVCVQETKQETEELTFKKQVLLLWIHMT